MTTNIIVPRPTPIQWPWPLPWPPLPSPPLTAERSAEPTLPISHGDIIEVMEACYVRPDVRGASVDGARVLTELLAEDEQAIRDFFDLLGVPPVDGEEREPISLTAAALWVVGSAAVGAIVGYFARPN